jgi:N6-L-threonylcarbamoyladenine synthase
MRALGFDTSNYTTSVAEFHGVGGENCSRLLDVKPGELGLRQSDALFAHVRRLPELVDALCGKLPADTVRAVGASTRPRAVEGSYMPCFLAGESLRNVVDFSTGYRKL